MKVILPARFGWRHDAMSVKRRMPVRSTADILACPAKMSSWSAYNAVKATIGKAPNLQPGIGAGILIGWR